MTASRSSSHLVSPSAAGDRLDQYLADTLESLSRSRAHQLIRSGAVLVNGKPARPSHRLQAGDAIRVEIPAPVPIALVPEAMPLVVVYEDEDMLVLDKPAGLVVHPSPGHWEGTLVHGLLARYPCLPGIGGSQRPGIVHRLDADTSGLLMVAKSERGLASLSAQFAARTIKKGYLALLRGGLPAEHGAIDASIGRDPMQRQRMAVVSRGRPAGTRFARLAVLPGYSLVLAMPETGRTHQIRVHFASIGHPVAGDALYGGATAILSRQFLHAALLRFDRPCDGLTVELTSHLAPDLAGALDLLLRERASEDDAEVAVAQLQQAAKQQFEAANAESATDSSDTKTKQRR